MQAPSCRPASGLQPETLPTSPILFVTYQLICNPDRPRGDDGRSTLSSVARAVAAVTAASSARPATTAFLGVRCGGGAALLSSSDAASASAGCPIMLLVCQSWGCLSCRAVSSPIALCRASPGEERLSELSFECASTRR